MNYPALYEKLQDMEKDSFNSFKPNTTLQKLSERFDSGYIPKRKNKLQGDKHYEQT